MPVIDSTRSVRSGEELDLNVLRPYLRQSLGLGESFEIRVEQFPGGHSNLTYLVVIDGSEYVLRRPPFGSKVKSAHDMSREYRVLSKLCEVYDKAPRPVAFCEDDSLIGAQFYVMERLSGVILRKQPPSDVTIDEAMAATLCRSFVDTLAELHSVDYAAAGLGDFGRPAGFVERQVTGWTKRYGGSQTDDIPAVAEVAEWLAANMPDSPAPTLIHNDFKFDNLVLDPDDISRIVGILDWEMATVGDPLMDLGTALCYWVEATDPQPLQMVRFGPTTLPGMMTRRELIDRYASQRQCDVSNAVFYYAFGLFKTAVVAQQIYYRFAQGLTKDPRFAMFIEAVRIMSKQAADSIARGHV
jgi:aminoglycoside phosphotransferase (APT) family kinase protein